MNHYDKWVFSFIGLTLILAGAYFLIDSNLLGINWDALDRLSDQLFGDMRSIDIYGIESPVDSERRSTIIVRNDPAARWVNFDGQHAIFATASDVEIQNHSKEIEAFIVGKGNHGRVSWALQSAPRSYSF